MKVPGSDLKDANIYIFRHTRTCQTIGLTNRGARTNKCTMRFACKTCKKRAGIVLSRMHRGRIYCSTSKGSSNAKSMVAIS
eukprot:3758337-Pyramimonas_sp.AAC.1